MNTLVYKKKWPGLICLVVSLATGALLFSWLCRVEAARQTKDDVVHIVSDRLEAYEQQRQVIFIGNVVAKQGELTILGDRMTIFYLAGRQVKSKVKLNVLTFNSVCACLRVSAANLIPAAL